MGNWRFSFFTLLWCLYGGKTLNRCTFELQDDEAMNSGQQEEEDKVRGYFGLFAFV